MRGSHPSGISAKTGKGKENKTKRKDNRKTMQQKTQGGAV